MSAHTDRLAPPAPGKPRPGVDHGGLSVNDVAAAERFLIGIDIPL